MMAIAQMSLAKSTKALARCQKQPCHPAIGPYPRPGQVATARTFASMHEPAAALQQ